MKKFLLSLSLIGVVAFMPGCSGDDEAVNEADNAIVSAIDEAVTTDVRDNTFFVWTDPETGVQYIVYHEKKGYSGFGGITPRLNADGSICVVPVENQKTE